MNTMSKINKKAQMKIQEMAFVLVAIMIFFSMVVLVYFSIRLASLREDVVSGREEGARELARKLADIPEFSWAGCPGCIDGDKLLKLKGNNLYSNFWDVDYLMVETIYPTKPKLECNSGNYPACSTITIINKSIGTPASAFVSICGYEPSKGGYVKCELGKIYVSAKSIT